MTPESFQQALRALQKRAATDEQFRELAKSDPHAALKEVGFDVSHQAKIKFTEPEEGMTISLLPKAGGEGTLSDDDLENAAGGTHSVECTPFLTFTPGCGPH